MFENDPTHEAKSYPDLDNLLGGYFHQDFDLAGGNLQEIIATYSADASDELRKSTRADCLPNSIRIDL
jgi:hypothetical protein